MCVCENYLNVMMYTLILWVNKKLLGSEVEDVSSFSVSLMPVDAVSIFCVTP